MTYNFKDKVIVITGAASGIGCGSPLQTLISCHCIKLATLSATLALCDLDFDNLEKTSKLCSVPSSALYIDDVDVSSVQEVKKFIEATLSKFGALHHVFNCAGVNPTDTPLEETTDEYWDKLVGTNLKGIFNVTRACIPYLRTGASFVNVSSILGIRPAAQNAVYCATKFGLIGFSKSMALELGPKGIRTNIIAPGYINTPTNAGIVKGGDAVESMKKAITLGRLGTPEDVADVVAFLFSEDSRFMNGSVVEVDGGTLW